MSVSFESITVFLPVFVFLQLDSKAQGELKDGMKIYNSEPGLKKSWDNVQKMVNTLSRQCMITNVALYNKMNAHRWKLSQSLV